MNRQAIEQQLAAMQAQEQHLEAQVNQLNTQVAALNAQLSMTRGAVQVLQHLLTNDDEDPLKTGNTTE